ncbi:glycosyltransferase [Micromonospora sp. STR1s_5]|nr:glycosyltransferase [Micromonospora sp. STR1s_5]
MARRDILFVHTNFPAQFRHLAAHLARDPNFRVFAFSSHSGQTLAGVRLLKYQLNLELSQDEVHPFARRFDAESRRAEQILYLANLLRSERITPDVIFVHPGWGEALPLRLAFPRAKIVAYCEFFYSASGLDVGFDPEFPEMGLDGLTKVHLRNAATLLALVDADFGVAPTQWQRDTFPAEFRPKIRVLHDGIDTNTARPDATATITTPSGVRLSAGDEVITFVARNLEPYRGYHVFMRALPAILRARPYAHVLIVGGNGVSYGAAAPPGQSWASIFLDEVRGQLDQARVHFLGPVEYRDYLKVLQVSAAHVYLTYPFVLSWSLLEAMATGCLVIGSDTPPVQEAVQHERTGLLVPFFDQAYLAETVTSALIRPGRTAQMRERARRETVARYDLRSVALPAYLNVINALQSHGA